MLVSASLTEARLSHNHQTVTLHLKPFYHHVLMVTYYLITDGLNIPVEEWQKAIQGQLENIRKLEQDYEGDLIAKKVR